MKFTFNWLKEYLETDAGVAQICESLTNIGLEVESYEDQAQALSYFSVAKIIDAKNHENSSKLKICQTEVEGGQVLQIICGAANARAGIKVAYAKIGAVIPANKMVIKKAKIAGVESNGMLCSLSELGLEGDDEGIIEIDDKYVIGTKIAEIFGKNDAVIEINVTPNRGDCLGVHGIARDLAASGLGQLKKPQIKSVKSEFSFPLNVKNEAAQHCNYAAFRAIKNVKNCASPKWLQEKLNAVGVGSISAVVDVTNYVMLCLNRPMHAYDGAKLSGEINIRLAKNAEKFTSLKDVQYNLNDKILVISDQEKALAVAGVIGSKDSSCNLETSQIILEAACFDAVAVAKAGRELNIITDSRYRFERGVDVETCLQGIEMATQLILEICGGHASEIKIVAKEIAKEKEIEFDLDLIKKIIGIEVPSDVALEILQKLEFKTKNISGNKYLVQVPTYRHDVTIARDLVEEVVRIYGYNKINSQTLQNSQPKFATDILDLSRQTLIANGMVENINWSFCDQNLIEIFAQVNEQLLLANPISSDLNHMRANLLIGLILSYQKNYVRGFANAACFEIGKVFTGIDASAQRLQISGIRAGMNKEQSHYNDQRNFDIFDVKKDLFDVLEIFGLKNSSLQIGTENLPKYYHPHRAAVLKLGKNIVGYFGEIHPKITAHFDLKTNINAFEIFVDALPQAPKVAKKSYQVNDLQTVWRDFAFLVNKDQAVGEMVKTIENCEKQLIKQVDVFDIFSGKNIEEGKKSVALRVIIQPLEKSLTSAEIDEISKKIIDAVAKFYGASLRI